MHTVQASKVLNHDIATVWQLLDQFGSIYKYHPAVKSSRTIGESITGLGAQRICNFYDDTSLKETICEYEPMRGYSLRLSEFALPLKKAISHFSLSPVGKHKTRLTVTLEFVPKFGLLGWLLAHVAMKPTIKKALKGLIKGAEDHLATGRVVGKKGVLMEGGAPEATV